MCLLPLVLGLGRVPEVGLLSTMIGTLLLLSVYQLTDQLYRDHEARLLMMISVSRHDCVLSGHLWCMQSSHSPPSL